jgi:CHAT domain-containing protein/Tfp pilus assembly protein PilF
VKYFTDKLCVVILLLVVFLSPGANRGDVISGKVDTIDLMRCRMDIERSIESAMDLGDQRGVELLKSTIATKSSCLPANDTTLGNLFHKTGVLCYMNNQYDDAVNWFSKARVIRERSISKDALLNTLNGLTQTYLQLFQYDLAEELIEKQLELTDTEELQYSETRAELYLADAQLAFSIEDYSRCREKLVLAVRIFNKVNVKSFNHGLVLNLLGASSDLLNKTEDAISYYEEAGDIFEFNGEPYFKALTYHNLGIAFAKLKDYDKANRFFNFSYEILSNSGDSLELARHYIEKAKVFSALNNYKQTYEFANKSLLIRAAKLPDWHSDVIESQLVLGNVLSKMANEFPSRKILLKDSASRFFDSAILAALASPRSERAIEPLVGKAIHILSDDQMNINHSLEAHKLFLRADSLIHLSRLKFRHQESKIEFTDKLHHAYEFAIRNALNLFERTKNTVYFEQALALCEKSKATAMRDKLHRSAVQNFAGIPDSIIKKERQLNLQLGAVTQALLSSTDRESEIYLSNLKLLEVVKRKMEDFDEELEREYPRYFQWLREPSDYIALKDLQKSLNDGSVLLEYFVGDEEVFVFGVSGSNFNYWKLGSANFVIAQVDSFNSCVEKSLDVAIDDVENVSKQTYRLILKQPLEYFQQKESVKDLKIVPDGAFGQVPFDALIVNDSVDEEGTPGYFLKKFSHCLLFSNRLLLDNTSDVNYFRDKSCAIFGIDYNSDAKLYGNSKFPPLPFVVDEVKDVASVSNGTLYLNEKATLANLMEELYQSEVLHLAVHGVLNEKNPEASGFIFSKNNISDVRNNVLTVPEIYGLNINSDLVYLSACFSGKGKLTAREGVISLSSAFTYAGAKSQVITLWEVSDRASAEVAVKFYDNLHKGFSKNEALRLAKLSYLKESPTAIGSLPFFWAGLVVVGNAEPMYTTSLIRWSIILTPLFLLAGIWLLRKKFIM